jgi:isocitrate dehydrogenase (NAD+)
VLKALTGLFLEAARDVAKHDEARVAVDDRIVDACAMQLVLDPCQFDVILATNLLGAILSDEIAGLIGGLGLVPGANIGAHAAIFAAVHGSAPDIAGKGLANPLPVLLAAALMLDHVGLTEQAARLRGSDEWGVESGQGADARSGQGGRDAGVCRGGHQAARLRAPADSNKVRSTLKHAGKARSGPSAGLYRITQHRRERLRRGPIAGGEF